MAKLGYTWYPKDWNNSDGVFELNLAHRGLYRELIDLAMLSDNKIELNFSVWCRKWDVKQDELDAILSKLVQLKLIEMKPSFIHVPSCESRLLLVRSGRKGGEISKPTPKPEVKGIAKGLPKPDTKGSSKQTQKQKKRKEIEKKDIGENVYRSFDHLSITRDECNKLALLGYTKQQIDTKIDALQNRKDNKKYKTIYLTILTWLRKDFPNAEAPKENNEKIIVPHYNSNLPVDLGDGTPA